MGNYGLQARNGRDLVIVSIALGTLAITSVVLRVISRRMRKISLGLDDYLMLVALCFVIVSTILVITMVTHGGVGLHMDDVTVDDLKYTLKLLIPLQALYGTGLSLIKTSLMVLYYRLFGTKRSLRIAIYITGAIVWAWGFSIVLESFLICKPIEFNYNPFLPGGTCGNRNAAFVVAGVMNMITDFMVMLLPVPYIWKLQLPVGRKVGLSLTFTLGLLCTAISMVRVFSLLSIDFADAPYTLPLPLTWSIVEEQLAIVTANLPILRHVFATILPKSWMGSTRRKASTTGISGRAAYLGSDNDQNRKYSLTRMDGGVNRSEVSSDNKPAPRTRVLLSDRWSDEHELDSDERSDKQFAIHGAPPAEGIQVHRDFRIN